MCGREGLELLPVVTALNEAGSKYVEPKHGHHVSAGRTRSGVF